MLRYSDSVLIQRPVADVFDYMDDVGRENEWQPNLQSAKQEPPVATAVGTRRHYVSGFLGREIKNSYEVTVLEPNRLVRLESLPGSTVSATNEIRWAGEGTGTRVTMTVEGKPKGALRFVPDAVIEAAFRSHMKDSLSLLKQRLEGEA